MSHKVPNVYLGGLKLAAEAFAKQPGGERVGRMLGELPTKPVDFTHQSANLSWGTSASAHGSTGETQAAQTQFHGTQMSSGAAGAPTLSPRSRALAPVYATLHAAALSGRIDQAGVESALGGLIQAQNIDRQMQAPRQPVPSQTATTTVPPSAETTRQGSAGAHLGTPPPPSSETIRQDTARTHQ